MLNGVHRQRGEGSLVDVTMLAPMAPTETTVAVTLDIHLAGGA
jgi:hypothetical protein